MLPSVAGDVKLLLEHHCQGRQIGEIWKLVENNSDLICGTWGTWGLRPVDRKVQAVLGVN